MFRFSFLDEQNKKEVTIIASCYGEACMRYIETLTGKTFEEIEEMKNLI